MKIRVYLAMAAAALLMSNCSQEETPNQVQGGTNTLTAIIENGSRSAVTDGGVFSWTTGDKISVYNGTDFTEFTYSGSGNTFTSEEAITSSDFAIYPASNLHKKDGETLTVNMATEYAYGSTNAPMLANGDTPGSTTLNFKHLGGLMRFVVKGVPNTAESFTFTANSDITGDFVVTEDEGNSIIVTSTTANNNKSVTINFESTDVKDVMTFYIPLPTGTYNGYTVSVGDKSHTTDAAITNTINRGTLLLMPTFTYPETGNELVKGDDNMVILNADEAVSMDVTGNEEVTVNVEEGATATLSLNAPEETTNGTVTISDGSDENTESSESSTGTLNVTAANVSTLNINTPSLTVKLASGSYDKVEALTAQQTLIIGEGVTIGELVVKGGNVKLEGNATLSNPLVVNQNMILDLGDKTLTTTESGVIVKKGAFTIKNGTLSATNTGCDAISIQGETDAEIKVTVESSATLTAGDCCIVVPNSNQSTNIIIETAGTLTTESTGYAAIQANGNTEGLQVNITDGKITSAAEGVYFPCNTDLNISGGEITGTTAVYHKSGNLTISGGTLKGIGDKADYVHGNNGCNATGDALVIEACDYPKGVPVVSITGGTFISTNAKAIGYYQESESYKLENEKFITGGTFSDPSACYYLGTGAEVAINMVADYTGAGFKTTSGQKVAMTIAEGKTYTVTAPLVGSTGTQNLGFQFLQGSTVSINGGTITSSDAKMLINNYSNLTLKGVTLAPSIPNTMNGQTYYVLSNNCGIVNIEEGTTITAPTSSDASNFPTVYAFDVCKYASYPNVSVNVKGGTITGNVEYTGTEGDKQKLVISGGTINGNLVVTTAYQNAASSGGISIEGGTQEGDGWDAYKSQTEN